MSPFRLPPSSLEYVDDIPHNCVLLTICSLKMHHYVFWTCSVFEIFAYLNSVILPPLPPLVQRMICSAPQPAIRTTPLFTIGVLAVLLGTYIRLDCFKALGTLFTFDLTILPEHKLITSRFYAYVRHPAYTGSMLLVLGLTFAHLTPGSWLTECALPQWAATLVSASWWMWTLSVGVSRAKAEDKEMRKTFQPEWDVYAADVPWWFFPGLC
jgi:protein-S-isoprenylcysteine O-methyltransferase Ste14